MRLFSIVFLLFVLPSLSFADCSNRVDSIQSVGDIKAAFRCLNNEIRVLKQQLKQGGSGTVVVNPMPNLPTPTISETTTEREIKYDLLGCTIQNTTVECKFLITRLGSDTGFYIKSYTRMYDENGDEHSVSYMKIGNKSSTSSVDKRLISNIPKKAIVRFNGVPPQSTRIAVLEFQTNYSTLTFRDIALQR